MQKGQERMLKHSVVGLAVIVGLMLAGCGAQSGKTVVKFEKGKDARMTEAPEDATYALYSTTDMTPKVRYTLKKGDKLGFENKDGTIYAVAGSNQEKIDPTMMARNWYWKMQKSK